MLPIKNIIKDLDEFENYVEPYNTMAPPKKCECGNDYYPVEVGENFVVDPRKCEECIKNSIEEEKRQIMERANNALKAEKFTPFESACVIPPGCEDATFENFNPENDTQIKALNKSKEFIENIDLKSNRSLMFQGTPGIGKSHLSVAIHKELRDRYISTVIIDSPSLFQKFKNLFSYSDSRQAQEKLMKQLTDVEVLIFDDIGAEYVKENNGQETWASDILYQIMNARQTKVNVFSTNYKSADLKQKYGSLSSRIISRMLSGAEVIKIEGQDQRMKGFE